jgi:Ca2+-transporting ATPase
MAGRGLRVLAAAVRDLEPGAAVPESAASAERDLVFVGLVGMQDPPRPSARQAVADCRAAGIRVVMITGDQAATALAIATELGIAGPDDQALTGVALDRLDDDELRSRAPRVTVYARVTAAHKLRIVRAWRSAGGVVAMTGDGVNDAPAIKGADIGIAMGRTGTEVTKEASDMVITDDRFETIVAAVREGRGVYANIRKALLFLLSGNAGELAFMTACVGLGLPLPLLPVHLLWINLLTDGLPALCLATDPIEHDVMRQPPRSREERMTDGPFLGRMLATGLLTAGVATLVYLLALRTSTEAMARAHAFSALVYAELLRSFGARSETRLVTTVGLRTNLRLLVVVLASMGLQLLAPHLPGLSHALGLPRMPLSHCLWLLAAGSLPLVVLETTKALRRKPREP